MREIQKKKDFFALLEQWHAAFDVAKRKKLRHEQFFNMTSTLFLLSLFGDSRLPTHRRSGPTFALELKAPPGWIPNVNGIPGEFVLFDSSFTWTFLVTHEEFDGLFA